MAKGYTSVALVAQYLGQLTNGAVSLTTDQQTTATTLMAAAEAYIDRVTRRAWALGQIKGEQYDLDGPVLYLKYRPVTSVEQVRTRTTTVGDTPITLIAGTDYELLNSTRGELRFLTGYVQRGALALVDYTPLTIPVPGDIQLAATMIVAHTMALSLFPDRLNVKQEKMGDIAFTYQDAAVTLSAPGMVTDILAGYRMPLVI